MNIIGAKLLDYSFKEIEYRFSSLSDKEKLIVVNQENLDEIHKLVVRELELEAELKSTGCVSS